MRSLLTEGPATAPELARRLRMTAAGVRRHLDWLLAEELIESGERPAFGPAPDRGRGRPPKVYSVTQSGRDTFEHGYDDLAAQALRFLREQGGDQLVLDFAARRAEDMERRYLPVVADKAGSARADALAGALTRDGFAASVTPVPGPMPSLQICQRNCPVSHVAGEFPELCEHEGRAMARLLGANVTRLATIAHGDGICTSLVSTAPLTEVVVAGWPGGAAGDETIEGRAPLPEATPPSEPAESGRTTP